MVGFAAGRGGQGYSRLWCAGTCFTHPGKGRVRPKESAAASNNANEWAKKVQMLVRIMGNTYHDTAVLITTVLLA